MDGENSIKTGNWILSSLFLPSPGLGWLVFFFWGLVCFGCLPCPQDE
jgi:hypothetical protein